MVALGIKKDDLVEKFILGSGKGGQKVNKSSTCVYLKHLPSGIEIKCSSNRSRELNRYYARKELCDKIERKRTDLISKKEHEIAKIRRQKQRRKRRTQLKLVDQKRQLSEKKQLRKPPSED